MLQKYEDVAKSHLSTFQKSFFLIKKKIICKCMELLKSQENKYWYVDLINTVQMQINNEHYFPISL